MPNDTTVCAILLAAVLVLLKLYVSQITGRPPRRPPRRPKAK